LVEVDLIDFILRTCLSIDGYCRYYY
jgi:hypothetical protein